MANVITWPQISSVSIPLSTFASGATLSSTQETNLVYSGAGGGSATISASNASNIGITYKIINPSSGNLTITTSSSQTFNNKSGSTSLVVPANSSTTLRHDYSGSTYYIGVISVVGSVTF